MISFRCKPFYELTAPQLYSIMALRQEVFIVEQNCAYLDADGKDLKGYHLTGYDDDGKLVAYARLLPKGVSYDNFVSIGRIATSPSIRGTGAGQQLMRECLSSMDAMFTGESIKISGQSYLRNFYESFGFVVSGDEYMEDEIPHLPMVR